MKSINVWMIATPALVVATSCARGDTEAVQITISGAHSLALGNSVQLTAATDHGTDHGYEWTSSDSTIATVAADGTVSAVAAGEVSIVATGLDTDVAGDHPLVVLVDPSGNLQHHEKWAMSPHADATSESFTHWDEDGAIPAACARCHSRQGFLDYLGADGSEVGVVNRPASIGTVVDCLTCHDETASRLDSVEFPSGEVIGEISDEARCMTCHQGRASTDSVDEAITAAAVGDDQVSDDLGFQNVHYYPAGAVLYAGQVRGGYQYGGQVYDHRFRHVPDHNTCVTCHDSHSTQVRVDECVKCHAEAVDLEGAKAIRMIASRNVDYDGDGDTSVGVYHELVGLRGKLYAGVQAYANEFAAQTICYSPNTYPYWFNSQTGASSECAEADATFANAYKRWTPRLLRATYNYQLATKDPGAYAHNSRYVFELLHDSIQDLNTVITAKVDMSAADRNAPGHFNGSSEASRHWDEDESVSPGCSTCHGGAPGFRFYLEHGVGTELLETANGLECYTCHENFSDYELVTVASTVYPSGVEIAHSGHDNACATCHRGREAKATIDAAIAGGKLGFRNVHYAPAAAVRSGAAAQIGYEYEGKTYAGPLEHANRTECTGCHDATSSNHTFSIDDVWQSTCQTCHSDQLHARDVRMVHLADYNGNGDTTESLALELDGLADAVLSAMRSSAEPPICYAESAYPYWFVDRAGSADGICVAADAAFDNRYADWTPLLMKAAHNYQLHRKDVGGYAHNFEYVGQLLVDSAEDLGADVGALIRP